jgi:hypothetical protein
VPNEATNFRESLAENMTDIVFGQGHFTETVWFFPDDQSIPPRDIAGVITRKITRRNADRSVVVIEGMVRIKFQRSATLGVVRLVRGDAVRLPEANADCDRWTYQETVAETPHSVTATFMKSDLLEIGNIQTGQI